jgi:ribosomal protein S18 acetylase RimI-like enzyme
MSSPNSSPQPKPEPIRWRRIVDAADPKRIRDLVAAAGVFAREEAQLAAELAETTLSGIETYRFLFAERGGELLGYTCFDRIPLSAVSFDLYWIAVAPRERGTGLAAELLSRTTSFIKGKRGRQVFAETSSREPYASARAFYLKSGFEEVARFADFYDAGDDKLIYRLLLT